jgi:hypothetical protein
MMRVIEEQLDDGTFDDILRELALARMIERGLADSDAGRTIGPGCFRHEAIWRFHVFVADRWHA